MHIDNGVVDGAKIFLSLATATGAVGITAKMAWDNIKNNGGTLALATRAMIATVLVFFFFQVLPHYEAGVSEVHFILGSTLFLLFGGGAASIGLAMGLLLQGVLVEPLDLPQYGMNVTTLLVPLWAVSVLAKKIIAPKTAYVDLQYKQTLALSTAYQGGVIAWVAFWVAYGQGFGAETVAAIATFAVSYAVVIVIEPVIDLAVLYTAKTMAGKTDTPLFNTRLHNAAV